MIPKRYVELDIGRTNQSSHLANNAMLDRMHQEHSFSIPEPERRSSLFGSWGSASISQSPSKKEQNENQPLLLSKQGGKKKTSIFSLFNLRGEG